jgi:lipopolysaccharide transport system ATP-binding protein
MTIAIKIENLSKQYMLRHQKRERYVSLRDVITNKAKSVINGVRDFGHTKNTTEDKTREKFWAVKDINLEIQQGDRVGIIGRNGAGKSTLLKLLSRIVEPTSGKISINGRMSSLLEVGTGFHPELTGRENVYLNGAVLGMRHFEIKRKFDEIVAFADVEKFLDTPVKHYSSGMYMRLAFSVAAHLDPEILVVDEVLAVGDAQFQKKCLGKMKEVSSEGRTILFVSHNMNAIEQLCNKAVHLKNGQTLGVSDDVRLSIKDYMYGSSDLNQRSIWTANNSLLSNRNFTPVSFYLGNADGKPLDMPISNDADCWVYIKGEIQVLDSALQFGYAIYNEENTLLYWNCQTDSNECEWPEMSQGRAVARSKFPKNLLNEGQYRLEMILALYHREWIFEPGVNSPTIEINIQGGLSNSPYWMVKRPGVLAPIISWKVNN